MRRALAWALLLAVPVSLTGCLSGSATDPADVVATVYPLAFFASRVAGDDLTVEALVPAGVEPHDWEPSPRALVRLQGAKVFVYNGAGLDPWADRIAGDLGERGMLVVEATRGVSLLAGEAHDPHVEEKGAHEGHDETRIENETAEARDEREAEGGVPDPHAWLDPVRAERLVDNVAAGLAEADPANATAHEGRAARLKADLRALHGEFEAGLADCERREVLVTHEAFGYLASRYAFEQHGIAGLSPDAEPSPARIAALVDLARDLNVTHVYFETLVSARVAEVIAEEVGAKTLVLNPLEGLTPAEAEAGKDYFSIQRQNLQNLRRGMGCA